MKKVEWTVLGGCEDDRGGVRGRLRDKLWRKSALVLISSHFSPSSRFPSTHPFTPLLSRTFPFTQRRAGFSGRSTQQAGRGGLSA